MLAERKKLDFGSLVAAIRRVHEHCAAQAGKAVNISLTLRNWAIGYYIREYEQRGADRAKYGRQLLDNLADKLQQSLDRCYTGRYLGLCRQLYEIYPQIGKSLISKLTPLEKRKSTISESVPLSADSVCQIVGTVSPQLPISNTIRASAIPELAVAGKTLLTKLSFTHFVELITLNDSLQRAFYEFECIRGNWSVRELKEAGDV